jgi:16S rRNA (guanine527-N7)-methyltransferase
MEKTKTGLELITQYFPGLSDNQKLQFEALGPLYKEWNSKINVLSRKDIDSIYEKHILHSLSISAFFRFTPGTELMDLGTGGGFPGIPLAILFPQCSFLLLDSIRKKTKVVESIVAGIGLTNTEVLFSRAEDIKNRQFDIVLSRAVASLKELLSWSRPLIRQDRNPLGLTPKGMICLKGGDLSREIQECQCHPRIMEIYPFFPESYLKEKYVLYIDPLH